MRRITPKNIKSMSLWPHHWSSLFPLHFLFSIRLRWTICRSLWYCEIFQAFSILKKRWTNLLRPLGNVEEEEDWLTSCVVLDPKLSHLLRQSGLYLSENGQLPPRPPIFDKLRSPSEFREDWRGSVKIPEDWAIEDQSRRYGELKRNTQERLPPKNNLIVLLWLGILPMNQKMKSFWFVKILLQFTEIAFAICDSLINK